MELHVSLTSPFARVVRIAIEELGLSGRVRQVVVDPWTEESFRAVNPLAKVPALILSDGMLLTESPSIVAYLDEVADGRLLADRWRTMRLAGLANGVTEAVVKLVVESRRPEDRRWQPTIDRQWHAIRATLDLLESENHAPELQYGPVTLAVALAYLDFRYPDYAWRNAHPKLDGFLSAFQPRASFVATRPPPPGPSTHVGAAG